MQKLLNFQGLKTKLEFKDTKRTIKVILYSSDEELKILSDLPSQELLISFLKSNYATGPVGEVFYHPSQSIFLVSIGSLKKEPFALSTNIGKAMSALYGQLKKINESQITFEPSEYSREAAYYLVLASYSFDFFLQNKDTTLLHLDAPEHEDIIAVAHAQNFARFLGDTPANLMTPKLFVEYATQFLADTPVVVYPYDKEFITSMNMNLIISVSQGSSQEPMLLHLRYMGNPDKNGAIDLALVGKGVTFDSGGISIKPALGMDDMKYDMMGAATLLAMVKVVSQRKMRLNVTATFPLVENLPSGNATKPGDVFVSMNGITVAVDNTDAEGRLILADALTFAQRDEPAYLIDCATLTGAMVISLGKVYGGFFCNDEGFAETIRKASCSVGDPMWRMPLSGLYTEAMKSSYADLSNIGGPDAGSCKAAGFLSEFIEKNVKWAHMDIAGLMDKSNNTELYGKGATGRPVLGLVEIAKSLCDC